MQAILPNKRIFKKIRPAPRRSDRSQNKTTQRASSFGRLGFLNYRFTPVTEDKEGFLKGRKEIEQDFFASLKNLCTLYNMEMPVSGNYVFPLNIIKAYEQLHHQISSLTPDLELIIIEGDSTKASLATVQTLSTGSTLYYISVRPLINLLQNPSRQQEANSLVFIFAYLYHIVDIPWFRNCGSFLEYTYDCLESWLMDTPEPGEEEDMLEKLATIQRMNEEAAIIEKRLSQKKTLRGWQSSLHRFTPKDTFGTELKRIARSAWELYKAYPQKSILNSVMPDLLFPEEEERLRIDHYLSFFWDNNDALYDSLVEYIEACLREYGVADNPASVQVFDQPQPTVIHCFDFEKRLFELVEELCTLLNKTV